MANDIRRWCRSCSDPLTDGRRKFCSNACRQRAYRERRRIGFEENGELSQIELVNAMAAVLSVQRIESYTPEVRGHMRRVLKRALRTL